MKKRFTLLIAYHVLIASYIAANSDKLKVHTNSRETRSKNFNWSDLFGFFNSPIQALQTMDTITTLTQSVIVTITGISLGDAQQAEVFATAAAGLSQVSPGTKSKQCMHCL